MTRFASWASMSVALLVAGCDSAPATLPDAGGELDAGIDAPAIDASAVDAGAIDAGPPEPCESAGASETVACGNCGTVERFCTAGRTWAYGACIGEGECAPGTTGERACGLCGAQPARCAVTCAWEISGECTGEGECDPGSRTRGTDGCEAGSTRDLLCSDACAFEPAGACEADGCPTPGASETIACGMCGSQTRFCTSARVWDYGSCEGERGCLPGTIRTSSCGMCGTTSERCDATCTWIGSACSGEGVCTPGATVRTSDGCTGTDTRVLRCSASCGFTELVEGCSPPAIDAGLDGGRDAGRDAGVDAGRDAGVDAGRDAGVDAGRDAGVDAGRDAGPSDAGPPATSIGAIQRGEIADGASVTIRGVVVTAVRVDTFWVQDPAGGSMYAGIKVYSAGPHGLARNDRVDLEGTVHDYFGDTELIAPTIVLGGTATPIAPIALTVAQAATEPYEGMLVRLTDVSSYQYPYDCALDNVGCVDPDLWQVNGASGIIVYGPVYESGDWLAQVGSTSVIGVMSYRFDRRRILPRISADLP